MVAADQMPGFREAEAGALIAFVVAGFLLGGSTILLWVSRARARHAVAEHGPLGKELPPLPSLDEAPPAPLKEPPLAG